MSGNVALLLEWIFPRRRLLREIREAWAQPGTKDGWLADQYFRLTETDDDLSHVDDRTWSDLEFPRIFSDIDTTITPLGSQCLFRLLRTYACDSDQTEALHESLQTLRRDQDLREQIQLILASLNSESAAMIVDSLFKNRLEGPKHPRLTVVWSIVCIGLLAAIAASTVSLTLVIPIIVVNILIIAGTGLREHELEGTLGAMQRMLGVADKLSHKYTGQPIPLLLDIMVDSAARTRARRAFRLFGVIDRLPLGSGTWLDLLFLAKRLSYLYTVSRVFKVLPELRSAYDLLGSLDAAIAVASMLERTDTWCRPRIGSEQAIEIESGYHPLLDQPVPNSLVLRGRSALISGSNMAGKTTFVKMIGVNVILGRTIGICLAERATIPRSPVMVCIRSQESVESGKSRYFAEVEAILSFLRSSAHSPLVVIDEPFSGTNTNERIAAAKSVLSAIGENSLVLATTHDVELQELLQDRFDMYHFTENPDLEDFFDYHLRTGPSTEGNALRLLARLGFPSHIISEATAFVDERSRPARRDVD